MAMNYKEISRGLPEEELRDYAAGIKIMADVADSLQEQGILPARFAKVVFEIEIPEVSEQIYIETRKAVEATGAFITTIQSLTMKDLLREDEERGQRGEPKRLGYVIDDTRATWAAAPPEMEVFINPKAVRIEDSNGLPTARQKTKIARAERQFKTQLSERVMPFVQFIMADPSTMSQIEDAWMDAGNGLLFPNYLACTEVQTVGDIEGGVAHVGRSDPRDRRVIGYWRRDSGGGNVFAVPVGVLPRQLAA